MCEQNSNGGSRIMRCGEKRGGRVFNRRLRGPSLGPAGSSTVSNRGERLGRNFEHDSGLFDGQAGEESKLERLSFSRIELSPRRNNVAPIRKGRRVGMHPRKYTSDGENRGRTVAPSQPSAGRAEGCFDIYPCAASGQGNTLACRVHNRVNAIRSSRHVEMARLFRDKPSI
jgi:hypothetical protein